MSVNVYWPNSFPTHFLVQLVQTKLGNSTADTLGVCPIKRIFASKIDVCMRSVDLYDF